MPFYEIFHAVALPSSQEDELAQAITSVHLTKFPLVPKFFVNVVFTDISQRTSYVGGKRRNGNHLLGHVRQGERTILGFEDIRDQLEATWNKIIMQPTKDKWGAEEGAKYELQTLVLLPENSIGNEGGFEIPVAGQERAWLAKHWAEFKKRAEAGDDQFVDMVKAVEAKRLL